jgi:hypothetical protein
MEMQFIPKIIFKCKIILLKKSQETTLNIFGAFTSSLKAPIIFFVSVFRLSAYINLAATRQIFMKPETGGAY